MDKEVQVYESKFGKVRVVMIDGVPWFVGKDLAECLGYADTFGALKKHVDDEDKQNCQNDSFESPRGLTVVNESGMYSLALFSKLPTAKPFRRWITSEVIPSIRKTGSYSVKGEIPKLTPNPKYRSRMIGTAIRDIGKTAENMEKVFGVRHSMALNCATDLIGSAYGFDVEPVKKLIPAEEQPDSLNPAKIGAELGGVSATKVNKLLEKLGFQFKAGGDWKLTDEGKQYGSAMPYTNNHNGHKGYRVMWSDKVIPLVRNAMI
jgi:prophage antirepressor-like protein